jgi:hypothetical protein
MKEYIEYFSGLKRSYGVCKIDEGYVDPETGKKKWKHEWTKSPVTDQDYEDHIKGLKSIGIQPCTDEGMARFGAIDVDQYPINRKFYLEVIQEKKLPIIPILSKSGGLHLYVFTTRLVKAKEIRNFFEEFQDGPPCLQKLTKEQMTFTDGRDRFLYNYMVFAKKKYADSWQKMVLQAGRKYFSFDEHWTDDHIKKKISSWEKQNKGFTCTDPLIADVCMKAVCVKRKHGVLSDNKPSYPLLSNLQKINYKPNPEWKVTVEDEDGETVQLHIKNTYKLTNQQEFKNTMFEQAHVMAPSIKKQDFENIIKLLSTPKDKIEIIEPAEGTSPLEVLKKLLQKHIYGAQATSHSSFQSGRPLVESKFAWFVFDKFFDKLKNEEWKYDAQKTSYMISNELFDHENSDEEKRALFGKTKRFPGKDSDGNYFKPVKAARIPLFIFEEPEDIDEKIEIESEDEVV